MSIVLSNDFNEAFEQHFSHLLISLNVMSCMHTDKNLSWYRGRKNVGVIINFIDVFDIFIFLLVHRLL